MNHPSKSRIPPIFENGNYIHPWYTKMPNKPNPPKEEDIKKAQFKDKTYRWGEGARI
tara:strand:+ start:51 stop:221 length:171 start_codon:yes stop_codon:yes gene_type:complete